MSEVSEKQVLAFSAGYESAESGEEVIVKAINDDDAKLIRAGLESYEASKVSVSEFKVGDVVWFPVRPGDMADETGFPSFEGKVIEVSVETIFKSGEPPFSKVKYIIDLCGSFSQTTQSEGDVFSTKEEAAQAVKPIIKGEIEKLMKRVAVNEASLEQVLLKESEEN